tara:strand:- start:167 stop:796 length:630 start_codon:yes stop_codon:yes gene_type:complete
MKPRIEQKLAISKLQYPLFLEWISNKNGEILFPERIICSRYFDNFNMESFSDTLDNIVPRKKIRIRTYNVRKFLSSSKSYSLEIKQSLENARVKDSSEISSGKELANLCKTGIFDTQYGLCLPIVDISYTRHYFSVQSKRITIDEKIQYESIKDKFNDETSIVLDDEMVLEIKTDFDFDTNELMNIFEFPRTRFSKYERAIELLNLSKF